jgi:hypothetical protein
MKTDAQRIAAYNARMLSTLVDPTLSAVNTMAVANFSAYATDWYPKQQVLRGILDAAGIATPQYFAYEAFAGEVYHVSKVAGHGTSAVLMATALIAKYVAMFLVAATLKKICLDCFTITVP